MKLGTRKIKQKSKKITWHKRRKIKKMKIEEKAKGEEGWNLELDPKKRRVQ